MRILTFSLLCCSFIFTSLTYADAATRGLEIAKKMDMVEQGFVDQRALMNMVLVDANKRRSTRAMQLKTLEGTKQGDKTIIVFKTPRDVKGTALLTHANIHDNDDQWLYLPALKRTKRISTSHKTGRFMGSDFAYEDMVGYVLEKYSYAYIGEGKANSKDCYIIKRVPTDPHSGYSKQVVYVNKELYVPEVINFFDRAGHHKKTLVFEGYKLLLSKHWRAHKATMTDHHQGRHTILTWKNFTFGTGLTDYDFKSTSLRRLR